MTDPVTQDRKREESREVSNQMRETRAADNTDEFMKYNITPEELDEYLQNISEEHIANLHKHIVNFALHGTKIDVQYLGDAFYQAIWEQVKEEQLDHD